MPERQEDNNGIWKYPTVYPGANMKLNPNAVTLQDGLVEAIGLDGRFIGALRPFPGMADVTIHGVPTPSGSTTITSLSNIVFAKYVAIQKGLSNDLLKGIFYIADNPGATGKAAYFAYRDTAGSTSDVRLLEDFDTWADFKLTSFNDYDVTSLGRYIYACLIGDTTSTVTSYTNKKPAYNKAYFWDWKINSWDKFVVGFTGRFFSIAAERLLGSAINAASTVGGLDSNAIFETESYSPAGTDSDMNDGAYTYGVQLISRKHGLRSYLRIHTGEPTVLAALRYSVKGVNLPDTSAASAIQQIKGYTTDRTCLHHWGISHFDGFRMFCTPGDGGNYPVDKYSQVYPLNQIDEYIERASYSATAGVISLTFDHDVDPALIGDYETSVFGDGGLVQQPQYDPLLHDFGAAPRLKRIIAHDGLVVGVVDADEPTSFNGAETKENEKASEALVWSTLYAKEPENFPVENYYRLDNAAERFLQLVKAGDHLFGITNAGVYKITRAGGTLGVNQVANALGGVSRYGAVGMGASVFIITAAGVKEIDGNSGEIRSLSIMDRIILDDSEWASSLAYVQTAYDAKLGCLIFLNTSTKEVYLMWEATGAVTKLIEVPWTFLTYGPDALTDGPQRAYFITDSAKVHVIDGSRQMGKRSMCGVTSSETVNGTITTASTTAVIDSTATFPANIVGFRVYMLSGTRKGESLICTVRASATNLTVTGLSGITTVGDQYSVSPIFTRITLPQLVGQGGDIDPFVRKTVTSMAVALSDLAGEYTHANGFVIMGLKKNLTTLSTTEADLDLSPDVCVGRVNVASTRALPFLEIKGGNMDYEVQAVLVKGILGLSEGESRAGG